MLTDVWETEKQSEWIYVQLLSKLYPSNRCYWPRKYANTNYNPRFTNVQNMKSQNVATQDKIWAEVYGYNLTFNLTSVKSSSFEDIYP